MTTTNPVLLTQKWSNTTTRLLTDGGLHAWNVMDGVLQQDETLNALQKELEGFWSELEPARTTSDVQLDDLMSIVSNKSQGGEATHSSPMLTDK